MKSYGLRASGPGQFRKRFPFRFCHAPILNPGLQAGVFKPPNLIRRRRELLSNPTSETGGTSGNYFTPRLQLALRLPHLPASSPQGEEE
ncbi:MAG: hypothetical protein U5L09_13240 [Bacteroidales bacterium]|nr:hypothetical protein [Bacteroidales bacterium]